MGKCQAILCRDGKPLSLSLLHNIGLEEEYRRIRQHRAIITEVKSLEKLIKYIEINWDYIKVNAILVVLCKS